MNAVELAMHRVNTSAFIETDPVALVLNRSVRTRTASGGYKDEATSLAAQIFRLLPQTATTEDTETPEGTAGYPRYVLLAEWDADIARGDTFLHDGWRFEVVGIPTPLHTNSAYERKAEVVARGQG